MQSSIHVQFQDFEFFFFKAVEPLKKKCTCACFCNVEPLSIDTSKQVYQGTIILFQKNTTSADVIMTHTLSCFHVIYSDYSTHIILNKV